MEKKEKKVGVIIFVLSKPLKTEIEIKAKSMGLSMSSYCRMVIIKSLGY